MRDTRLDVIRGLAILLITINHTFPNASLAAARGQYSLEMGLFFNGADVFVAFSGLVSGLVYKKTVVDAGFKAGLAQGVNRAMQIFAYNAAAFLCVAVILAAFQTLGVAAPQHRFDNFVDAAAGTLFLYDPIPHFDILNFYILMLLILPVFVYFQLRSILPILLSAAIYVAYTLAILSGYAPSHDIAFFVSPIPWQFLFFAGAAIGMNYDRVRASLPPLRATLGYIMLYLFATHFMREQAWIVHNFSQKFDLGLLRMVDLVIVFYVIDQLLDPGTRVTPPVLQRIGSIGANSLFCFSVSLVVCYLGSNTMAAMNGGRAAYLVIVLMELGVLIWLGHILQTRPSVRRVTQLKWLQVSYPRPMTRRTDVHEGVRR